MLTKFTRDSGYSETKDNSKDGQKLEIKTTSLQNLIATAGALLSSLSDRLIFTTISAESNLSAQSPCSKHRRGCVNPSVQNSRPDEVVTEREAVCKVQS